MIVTIRTICLYLLFLHRCDYTSSTAVVGSFLKSPQVDGLLAGTSTRLWAHFSKYYPSKQRFSRKRQNVRILHDDPDVEIELVDHRSGSDSRCVANWKQCRGGSKVISEKIPKTMTSSQMEALNLFAGGIAGTVASCITNPLEVVKMQLQSSIVVTDGAQSTRQTVASILRSIVKRDGLSGFFRGLPPTLLGIIPSRSAYFYAYQRSKVALSTLFNIPEGSPPNALTSGLLAGLVSNTITNPIWMIKTRMTLLVDTAAGQKTYRGYGDVISSIYKQEGIHGFYKGIQASYWGCTEGAIQFLIYEQFKTRLVRRRNNELMARGMKPNESTELSLPTYFWSAALSKMLASIVTYPHEVARTRLREQARSGIYKYKNMWQTISLVSKEEGRKGLYSGIGIHLLKVVPNSALMFLTYEMVRRWLSEFTITDENIK